MIRIGMDLHGVIDADPELWISIANKILDNEWEVHIISGPSLEEIINELRPLMAQYNDGYKESLIKKTNYNFKSWKN